MSTTSVYFRDFFDEKEIPWAQWEIETATDTHIIDSDFVIALIKGTTGDEAKRLREQLTRLDFANAPVLPFLHHLATGYVRNL